MIDLLDEIERAILDRMKADRLELDPSQHVERISGLRGYPVSRSCG
ncbi:hypothetical protein [Mesorhizobium sp. WSM3859]|nr:hypothetical protein [Mesorhizobium sp. WSM3859]